MGLLYVINRELAAMCRVLEGRCEMLETSLGYSRTFVEAAQMIEASEGLEAAKPSRAWRKKKEVSVPEFLRSLAMELRDETLDGLVLRWQELRALEMVCAELASEFEGEDPVLTELRSLTADTDATLRTLAKQLGAGRRLIDPNDAFIDPFRDSVNESFRQLGLVQPYT